MSTSLAEQLQRLATPQTSSLNRGKERASLLFDPKKAATLRKETVYEIGINGLEELISKNDVFEQFINTLFSLTSKDFERSIGTAEVNSKLDKHIQKFLLLLSPYFSFNCTYKALEWLIYKYAIHEYNREDLLMLILPYHESNVFIRIVQLFNIKDDKDPWFFLKSLQKPGIHLAKQCLLNKAANDPFFIKFISSFILKIIKVHQKPQYLTVAFNFYCSVFTGAIEYSGQLSETVVAQMLPSLIKGLSSEITDFRAASYVVTARLVAKATLLETVLDKFVTKIAYHQGDLNEEAMLVYLVLYQSQHTYDQFPTEALNGIILHECFGRVLQNLNAEGSFIYPFLTVLLKSLFTAGLEEDGVQFRKFTLNLLDDLKIDGDHFEDCFGVFVDAVPRRFKTVAGEPKLWFVEVLKSFEKQYPTQFDNQVKNILGSIERNKRKVKLNELLKNASTMREKYDIFSRLYHPEPIIRRQAVEYFSKHIDELNEVDKEIFQTSLLIGLNDEDAKSVQETLKVIKTTGFIKGNDFQNSLFKVLEKLHKWNLEIMELENILDMLSASEKAYDFNVILKILPILLPNTRDNLFSANRIINSNFFKECPLFENFNRDLYIKCVGDFIKEVFNGMKGSDKSFLLKLLEIDVQNLTPLQKYCATLIICAILPGDFSDQEILQFFDILEKFSRDSNRNNKEKFSIVHSLKICRKGKFPIHGFLHCVVNLAIQMNPVTIDFDKNGKYLVYLTSIIYREKRLFSRHINRFHANFFKGDLKESKIEFLLHLAVVEKDRSPESLHLKKILSIVSKDCSTQQYNWQKILDNLGFSMLLLINLLTINEENVRMKVVEICQKFSEHVDPANVLQDTIFKAILEKKDDIIADSNGIAVALKDIYKKESISEFFLSCIEEGNPIYVKSGILEALSKVNSFDVFEKVCELALNILKKNGDFNKAESIVILKTIERFNEKVAKRLKVNSMELINEILKNDADCVHIGQERKSPSLLFIENLNSNFISNLSQEMKLHFVNSIIKALSTLINPQISLASNKLFRYIDLDADLILPQLIKMKDVQIQKDAATRRRSSSVPTIHILNTIEWKEGVKVLEIIQNKSKLQNSIKLIPILLDLLKKCLDFDEQTAVEYPKQLLLSAILQTYKKLKNEKLGDNLFNVELIVQCIRASQNPQTHHHALLVLAHCGSVIPTQVLHHVMAIFTFVGSSVLRYDDAYSFQLIGTVLDTIIPILVKDGDLKRIVSVLEVFANALLDIPEHRRGVLYSQFLQMVEPEKYLHFFILLVLTAYVIHNNEEQRRKRLDILTSLMVEFEPSFILGACVNLIHYLKVLPIEQNELEKGKLDIDPTNLTPKQYRHFKYTILVFIKNLISSREFVTKIAVLSKDKLEQLEIYYKDVIINIITYVQKINPIIDSCKKINEVKYFKEIQNQSLGILDGINAVLTPDMFLLVIKGLMTHNLLNIRKRALDLLNSKLRHQKFLDECPKEGLQNLVNPVIQVIENLNDNEDEHVLVQTALLSLELTIRQVAADEPERYIPVLEFVTDFIKSGKAQGNVLASFIICLAELCVTLRARAIQCLPGFMPTILKLLKQQKYQESPTLLCLSLLTAIDKILDNLSMFLSPYLKKLLSEISDLTVKWQMDKDDAKLKQFFNKVKTIKDKIGTNISTRLLIPAVKESYSDLKDKNKFEAITHLMEILSSNFKQADGSSIVSNLPEITSFFLVALEFRNEQKCETSQVNPLENRVIEALSSLVLKLSETNFRPLYLEIFEWSIRSEVKDERIITFYNVSCSLAQHLKGLFVNFAAYFISNAAQTLDACNNIKSDVLYFEDTEKNCLLLDKLLQTLLHVFKYATTKFINKEKFQILMQPIVDQLENDLGGIEILERRNEEVLTACIVQFAVATADDALWKQMNYQILLKMRNSNPKIQLVALKCLTRLVTQLGEDFLPLLPETIPFLSEMLENDDEEVEKYSKKSIQEMEKVLGENLQKYF